MFLEKGFVNQQSANAVKKGWKTLVNKGFYIYDNQKYTIIPE